MNKYTLLLLLLLQ